MSEKIVIDLSEYSSFDRVEIIPLSPKVKLPGGKAWVEALRSGEYAQCANALNVGDTYCCLGVLSKIQGRLNNEIQDPEENSGYDFGSVLDETNPLHHIIGESGTVNSACDIFNAFYPDSEQSIFVSLANLNDKGVPFKQIAEILEAIFELE